MKQYVTGCLKLVDIYRNQICIKLVVLLPRPNIRHRFHISNDPNLDLYGKKYYSVTCKKCQDHIS